MILLRNLVYIAIAVYVLALLAAFVFQRKLIFHPGGLPKDFQFSLEDNANEVFLKTADGETINGLFYAGNRKDVVLYFHGNAGDLSSWQSVAVDFTPLGYNFLIVDYRGYGKSSGTISEDGLYTDAEATYQYLIQEKGFSPGNIIIYGRSIGTGVAVELARRHQTKGLILEAAYSSLTKLANEKLPFLLPSIILRYRFNNIEKINSVKSPILFFHGSEDALIPVSHTEELFKAFTGKKEKMVLQGADHNNIGSHLEYHHTLKRTLDAFFQ
ncbi:alpha/beta hydrolase [Cytophagales bacterium WSM2-2]|nr:alpha/beta hydrolase [Cytophagales bacterium WSM2-2]